MQPAFPIGALVTGAFSFDYGAAAKTPQTVSGTQRLIQDFVSLFDTAAEYAQIIKKDTPQPGPIITEEVRRECLDMCHMTGLLPTSSCHVMKNMLEACSAKPVLQ